ncbi:hypothetical protein P6P90_09270 [Ectobacillus antri]|jgi:membrane protein implicated in regulation of membrane protease activity|uniref:Membrane protein NfeD2 N-terminal transmembrane domain-containing protein n=1 Tax=Ectobacillus antri TaxID=2486280 RepID=A0ABT6H706_9BACI|nr:hypothetical protein [Ectobacillus antri]MDG4657059.1 hypothetical protein [Ectobacillus antri]MDG5754161.1 hypothetical protein [Ectobacillus antri]
MLAIDWQTVYLYGLLIAGGGTLLYALFGDIWDAVHPISPIAVLSFFAVLSGSGYILQSITMLSSELILMLSAVIALVLVTCMMLFVIKPLSKAEQSNIVRMNDFIGTFGEVSIAIPEQGLGEIILTRSTGIQNMSAKSVNNEYIPSGTKVLVSDVKDGIVMVLPVPKHLLPNMRNGGK